MKENKSNKKPANKIHQKEKLKPKITNTKTRATKIKFTLSKYSGAELKKEICKTDSNDTDKKLNKNFKYILSLWQ